MHAYCGKAGSARGVFKEDNGNYTSRGIKQGFGGAQVLSGHLEHEGVSERGAPHPHAARSAAAPSRGILWHYRLRGAPLAPYHSSIVAPCVCVCVRALRRPVLSHARWLTRDSDGQNSFWGPYIRPNTRSYGIKIYGIRSITAYFGPKHRTDDRIFTVCRMAKCIWCNYAFLKHHPSTLWCDWCILCCNAPSCKCSAEGIWLRSPLLRVAAPGKRHSTSRCIHQPITL